MGYDRHSRELIGRLDTQLSAIINKAKREGHRGLKPDEQLTFNRLMSSRDDAEEAMRRNEQGGGGRGFGADIDFAGGLEELRDRFRLTPNQRRERARTPHAQAFDSYLRKGLGSLGEDERSLVTAGADPNAMANIDFRNAQSTTTGSQGGYIVPQGFSELLMEAMRWFGGVDGVVGEFTTETGNPLPYPTLSDVGNRGRVIGQNVQVVETDLAFGQVLFNAFILSSDLVLIPLALMEDSYFDLDALLARLLGIRLGRLLNQKGTIGTGSGEPTGIVTAAVAAGNTNVFPNGETASIAYNDLVNMEHAVDPAYRNGNSRWMFPDAMLKLLKKLVDGNSRPLWQAGLTASFADGAAVVGGGRPTILGYPYEINQDMAVPAANADSILFGDMSTFKVRKVGQPTILRLVERYADQVGEFLRGLFAAPVLACMLSPSAR